MSVTENSGWAEPGTGQFDRLKLTLNPESTLHLELVGHFRSEASAQDRASYASMSSQIWVAGSPWAEAQLSERTSEGTRPETMRQSSTRSQPIRDPLETSRHVFAGVTPPEG